MGVIVDIVQFFRTCENCRFSGNGTCRRPGGWWWDEEFSRCDCFERKEAPG